MGTTTPTAEQIAELDKRLDESFAKLSATALSMKSENERLRAERDALAAALRDISHMWEMGGISKGNRQGLEMAAATARAALAAVEASSPWTIEYRVDQRQWEVMEGTAHRGLYRTEEAARKALAAIGGGK